MPIAPRPAHDKKTGNLVIGENVLVLGEFLYRIACKRENIKAFLAPIRILFQ